jgi:hypothetical protein
MYVYESQAIALKQAFLEMPGVSLFSLAHAENEFKMNCLKIVDAFLVSSR